MGDLEIKLPLESTLFVSLCSPLQLQGCPGVCNTQFGPILVMGNAFDGLYLNCHNFTTQDRHSVSRSFPSRNRFAALALEIIPFAELHHSFKCISSMIFFGEKLFRPFFRGSNWLQLAVIFCRGLVEYGFCSQADAQPEQGALTAKTTSSNATRRS